MSPEENKALVRRLIEKVWNQGNLAVFDELYAPDFLFHDPGLPQVRTREEDKRWITQTLNIFPDLHITIEDLIAEGDQVAMRWPFRGTNTGALVTPMPLPATGKQVTGSGITIVRLVGGKAVEVWNQRDTLGEMQQLGVIPAPGQ